MPALRARRRARSRDRAPRACHWIATAALARIRAARVIACTHRVSSELRYYVDELEQRINALDQLFGKVTDARRAAHRRWRRRARAPECVSIKNGPRARPPARDALIAGIAETLPDRARAADPRRSRAHAATVIDRRGSARSNGDGLVAVTQVSRIRRRRGSTTARTPTRRRDRNGGRRQGFGTFADWQKFWRARKDIAIVLRGLFVREAIANDHGTWMLRAAAAEPDVVRVEVRPGARHSSAELLKDHIATAARARARARAWRPASAEPRCTAAGHAHDDVTRVDAVLAQAVRDRDRGLRDRLVDRVTIANVPSRNPSQLAPRLEPHGDDARLVPRVRDQAPRWADLRGAASPLSRAVRCTPPAAMAEDRRDRAHAPRAPGRADRRGARERGSATCGREELELRRVDVDIHPGRPDPRGYVIARATVPIRLGYAAAKLEGSPLYRVLVPRFDWSFVTEDLAAVPDTIRALVFAALIGDAAAVALRSAPRGRRADHRVEPDRGARARQAATPASSRIPRRRSRRSPKTGSRSRAPVGCAPPSASIRCSIARAASRREAHASACCSSVRAAPASRRSSAGSRAACSSASRGKGGRGAGCGRRAPTGSSPA